MFTTIRRYRVKLGHAEHAIRLADVELVPIVSAIRGFIAYQMVLDGSQSITSVSTYRDREGAIMANSAATQWTATRLASVLDGPAKVTTGEVRLFMNAPSAPPSASNVLSGQR